MEVNLTVNELSELSLGIFSANGETMDTGEQVHVVSLCFIFFNIEFVTYKPNEE